MKLALGLLGVLVLTAVAYAILRRRSPARMTSTVPNVQQEVVTLGLVQQRKCDPGTEWFELRYEDATGTTSFVLELRDLNREPAADKPFSITSGVLHRMIGSQHAPLMNAVARLHGAPVAGPPHGRLERLPIDVGVLAIGAAVNPLDWNIAGRYSTKEPGDWLVTKLFVPVPADSRDEADEEYCEIFLALNASDGIAEFSLKDSDYWAPLSIALPQVL
jgi:hypothetical protein